MGVSSWLMGCWRRGCSSVGIGKRGMLGLWLGICRVLSGLGG